MDLAPIPLQIPDPPYRRLRGSAGVIVLDVVGHRVELVKVEPIVHTPPRGGEETREKARYLVRVDGVERGHLVYPSGWQSVWEAYSLGRTRGSRTAPARLREPLDAHGAYVRRERYGVASFFPAWIDAGEAPTREEVRAYEADLAAAAEQGQLQREADDAAFGASMRVVAEKVRLTRMEENGNRSRRLAAVGRVLDRLRGSMDNEEAEALAWVMDEVRNSAPGS